jgi:formylglycine-generating enzyme required for sulfatase activity
LTAAESGLSLGKHTRKLAAWPVAIGTAADQVIQGSDKEALGAFDRVFADLVHIERDRPPTRKRATLAAFKSDESANKLVNALAGQECRVLVIGGDTREPSVEVAHEKLFTAWPRLKEWIEKCGDALRLIEHAKEEAQRWWDRDAKVDELWAAERPAEVSSAIDRFGKTSGEPLDGFIHPSAWLIERIKQETLSHAERLKIGLKLAEFGDPRPGVGLRPDGLPDIEWVDIEPGQVKLKEVEKVFEVQRFRIAKYPVTNIQFQAFIDAGDGYGNAEWWKGIRRSEGPAEPSWKEANSPRENVSWFDAVAFCRWLSGRTVLQIRLPTEWQWQLAATGGDPKREYPWPGGWDSARCNSAESRLNRTSTVGMYPNGATRQGVLDMAGNVWEWCLNKSEQPDTRDALCIESDERGQRVVRGGSWNDRWPLLRASIRAWGYAVRGGGNGFRLAQDIE